MTPLGELTALPRLPSWTKGQGNEKGRDDEKEKGKKGGKETVR